MASLACTSTNTQELLPLEGSSSAVWRHFGFPSKDGKIVAEKKKRHEVHCKVCFRIIKYNGNTTNMRFHLKEHHKTVFMSLPKSDSGKKTTNIDKDQATLPQIMSASQLIPPLSTKWNKLTDGVLYFIAKDMQPLDTIDDKGFRHMINTFEPRYTPPSRKTLTTKHLPQLVESEMARIKL